MTSFSAVQCVVCRLVVHRDDYGDLRVAPPGPHFPVLNQQTMTAYPGGDQEMFPMCCDGSFIPGPVVTMELSSGHEIEDDGEVTILWEQGQGN
jgi:hypothetical protein